MAVIGLSIVYTSAGIWGKPWGPPVGSVCGVYVGLAAYGHWRHLNEIRFNFNETSEA